MNKKWYLGVTLIIIGIIFTLSEKIITGNITGNIIETKNLFSVFSILLLIIGLFFILLARERLDGMFDDSPQTFEASKADRITYNGPKSKKAVWEATTAFLQSRGLDYNGKSLKKPYDRRRQDQFEKHMKTGAYSGKKRN